MDNQRRRARRRAQPDRGDGELDNTPPDVAIGKRTRVMAEPPSGVPRPIARGTRPPSTASKVTLDVAPIPANGDATGAPTTTTTPAPATAPPATAAAGLDHTLVDPYMRANWNDEPFWQLAHHHGLPGNPPPEVAGELDRWLTGFDLSSGDRRLIHLAAAVMSGAIDASLFRDLPAVGPIIGALQDVQSVVDRVARYGDLGDPLGQALAIVHAVIGASRARAADVQSVTSPLAAIANAINAAVTPLAAGATAASGGAAAPVTVPTKTITTALDTACGYASLFVDGIALGLDSADGVVTMLELANAAGRAKQMEATGQFERAAEYKDILRGVAIDGFFDGLKLTLDGALFGIGVMKNIPEKVLGVPTGVLSYLTGEALGGAIESTGALATFLDDTVGDELLGGVDVRMVSEHGDVFSFGDVLRSPRPPVPAPYHRTGEPTVDDARTATAATSIAAHAAVRADQPQWNQPLVDAITTVPPFSFSTAPDVLRPTWYIEQFARGLRQGVTGASSTTIDNLGGLINQLGASLQPALDLAVIGINGFIATNLPPLQHLAVDVNRELQKTRVDLAQARALVGGLQAMAGAARGAAATAAGVAIGFRDRLLTAIDALAIDLPAFPGIDQLESQWNQGIADFRAWVTTVSDGVILGVEAALLQTITEIENQLAALQLQIAAGGTVETELDAIYTELKELIDRAVTTFAAWQPVIPRLDVTSAGTWLQNLATQWRTGLAIERGQHPDPWATTIIPTIAQPHVTSWKATHGLDLERAFYPAMPAAELAACADLYTRTVQTADTLPPALRDIARASLQSAYGSITALATDRGVDALRDLWSREEVLVTTCRWIEDLARVAPGAPVDAPDTT